MASNSLKKLAGPAFISDSAANIYTQSALIYDILKHIHIANRTASPVTFSLFVGATGASTAGTELAGTVTVAANSYFDWFGALKLVGNVDFLVGIAGTASALVITVEGESGVI